MTSLETFFEKLELLPTSRPPIPNLFSAAGPGHRENPLTDLMALFMGSHEEAPRWLAKALLSCLTRKGLFDPELFSRIDWDSVRAEREVGGRDHDSDTLKRLDLVISDGTFVVGVEHKVFASAEHNPFHIYDNLLAEYGPELIVKCVLRPSNYSGDIKHEYRQSGWDVVSYSELLDTAYDLYGQDVAQSSSGKWQVFYQELLQHIKSVANPTEEKTMTKEELGFSLKNFHHLIDAANRLSNIEKELIAEGKSKISTALKIDESEIEAKPKFLPNEERVLRFAPSHWHAQSKICLVYFASSESEGDETIGFYIEANIELDHERLKEIEEQFLQETQSGLYSWYQDGDEKITWCRQRFLTLSVWPREYTKAGAMKALGDLAEWVDNKTFR